jgi:hypothetical protein
VVGVHLEIDYIGGVINSIKWVTTGIIKLIRSDSNVLVIDDGLRIFIKVRGDIYNLAKLKRPISNEAQTVTAPVIPT